MNGMVYLFENNVDICGYLTPTEEDDEGCEGEDGCEFECPEAGFNLTISQLMGRCVTTSVTFSNKYLN